MSEVFNKKDWKDRQSQHPVRRRLTNINTSEEIVVDVTREEGTVTVVGHPFNAANMNDLEDRIDSAVNTLQSNFSDGVDSIYNACVDKGSTPVSHSLADVVDAIENISGGDTGVDIFGTPTSDNPDNGVISTDHTPMTGYDAYNGFGNNAAGWVGSDVGAVKNDILMYHFTNDSEYRPTSLQYCSEFEIFGDDVKCSLVSFQVSKDGTTWTELGIGVGQNVTMQFDINDYFSYFRFVCTSESLLNVGLKNIKCYGERLQKGLDTTRDIRIGEFLFVE